MFLMAAAAGHGAEDDSAVVKVFEQIANIDMQAAIQKTHRDKLQLALIMRERQLEEKPQQMAAADQDRSLAEQQVHAARVELSNLQQQVDSVDDSVPEPIILPASNNAADQMEKIYRIDDDCVIFQHP